MNKLYLEESQREDENRCFTIEWINIGNGYL